MRGVRRALAVAVVLAGACAGPEPQPRAVVPPSAVTVAGVVRLLLPDFVWLSDPLVCSGHGRTADVTAGAVVSVTGPDGAALAAGQLGPGVPVVDGDRATACLFRFRVAGVPAGLVVYGLRVASRDPVQVVEEQLATPTVTVS